MFRTTKISQKLFYIELLKKHNAFLEGHFILSSGLHSKYYIQCAKIFENPKLATKFCQYLVKKIKKNIDIKKIDVIVAPAMGGLLIGYEIARQLNKKTIFCERVENKFQFRRNFSLNKNDRVLVVEDVITTGKSSLETYEIIKKTGAEIIAEVCLIKRDSKLKTLSNVPIISLIDLEFKTYQENNLLEELKKIPATKPGSRNI